MASKVLFAPMAYSRYEADQTLPAKFERLLKKELQGSQAYKQAVESWMDSQKGGEFESAADSLAQALAKSE